MKRACLIRPRYAGFGLLASVLLAASFLAAPLLSGEPKARSATGPQYDDKGELKRPTDYRRWVFAGTNIGLRYRQDVAKNTTRQKDGHQPAKLGDFHNVYVSPQAYEHYVKTGKFPDKCSGPQILDHGLR
jgi:hypothetical protein